jgi:prolyl-tRNA synthetase
MTFVAAATNTNVFLRRRQTTTTTKRRHFFTNTTMMMTTTTTTARRHLSRRNSFKGWWFPSCGCFSSPAITSSCTNTSSCTTSSSALNSTPVVPAAKPIPSVSSFFSASSTIRENENRKTGGGFCGGGGKRFFFTQTSFTSFTSSVVTRSSSSSSAATSGDVADAIAKQGDLIKALKASGKTNQDEDVKAAVAVLKELKAKADPSAGEAKKNKEENSSDKKKKNDGGGKGGKEAEAPVTPRSEDFSKWYLDVIRECELADYGPARGTMVIRPYGFAMWETTQTILNEQFGMRGVENCYFPQLIPYSFITKEASHVEGFAPELAVVTQGGGKTLEEPLVVRPTSETIVNHMLSQWIQSYRDLPIKLNQWCNVHRWEMRTRPFIRTLEFLWQEGHTAHATAEEANAMAMEMIKVYSEFAEKTLAMPVIVGKKSSIESFAGAKATFTMEAMMGDKKALQAGTSHDLGDNFAKAFETTFLDTDGKAKNVYQSSWGVSTRMMGGVIMTHGDDKGLTLPPKLAPVQVIVTPIWQKNKDKESVMASCDAITKILKEAGIRVKIDADDTKSPGWKFNFWEMKGVPIRIEIGPRDVEKNACVVARRDVPGKEGKEFGVSAEKASLVEKINVILDEIQDAMLEKARKFRDENIVDCATMADLEKTIEDGKWARCAWEGSDEEEKEIKEKTGATIRCFPFEQPSSVGNCIQTGKPAKEVCIFAKSY